MVNRWDKREARARLALGLLLYDINKMYRRPRC
jgi:hypothetical protein